MGKRGKKAGIAKRLLALAAVTLLAASVFAPAASAATTECATKYPIVLVHGAGFRDKNVVANYWGRIPAYLTERGAKIYYGNTDGWCSIEQGAKDLKAAVEKALAASKAEKVNIIAHSKGGLEARCMISSLGMADKVASLTTISTPHRGSMAMDSILSGVPEFMLRGVGLMGNVVRFVWGDRHPDFYAGVKSISTASAADFNKKNPDIAGVYYQSFAGEMPIGANDVILAFTRQAIGNLEGPNDGMVAVESAKWTNFRGVLRGAGGRGVSHLDEVDFRREDIAIDPILGAATVRGFYGALAAELKQKGY